LKNTDVDIFGNNNQKICRLHAVDVRPAALVSDEKRIRGVYATMRYTN